MQLVTYIIGGTLCHACLRFFMLFWAACTLVAFLFQSSISFWDYHYASVFCSDIASINIDRPLEEVLLQNLVFLKFQNKLLMLLWRKLLPDVGSSKILAKLASMTLHCVTSFWLHLLVEITQNLVVALARKLNQICLMELPTFNMTLVLQVCPLFFSPPFPPPVSAWLGDFSGKWIYFCDA